MRIYKSFEIRERILNRFNSRGEKPYKICPTLNIAKNTVDNMSKSMPKADTLAILADYLECSVDFLLGRDIEAETDPDIIRIMELLHDCSKSDLSEILSYVEFKAQKNLEAKKDASA